MGLKVCSLEGFRWLRFRGYSTLQFAVCSLQFAVWCLQFAVCSLQFAVCSLQCAVCSVQGLVGGWLVALGRALTVSWAPQRRESCHCSSELSPVSQSWKRAPRRLLRREREPSFGELKSRGGARRSSRSKIWGKRKLGGR